MSLSSNRRRCGCATPWLHLPSPAQVACTRHIGVSVRGRVSAARWEFAGSTGAARLAEVGRECPAEREPDLTVARRAGQAPGSAARAGASGSASPAGGGRPGSSSPWPGRARRGSARARCVAARRTSNRRPVACAAAGAAAPVPGRPRACRVVADRVQQPVAGPVLGRLCRHQRLARQPVDHLPCVHLVPAAYLGHGSAAGRARRRAAPPDLLDQPAGRHHPARLQH